MEEKAAAVDEVMAVAAVANDDDDDLGEGMQCSDHPYRRNPGGICAFCLQEKLGNLLSTTSPSSFFSSAATTLANTTTSSAAAADILLLKRSKSVAPRPIGDLADSSPRKKKKKNKKKHFWSFLYHHSSSSATATAKINQQHTEDADGGSQSQALSSSSGRKVGRSRSVGCGSRSFSGDFLERISTGLGDCTLRRVESHRETRKHSAADAADAKIATPRNVIKERVRCGGIFRMSSTSSSYWLSAAGDDDLGKGESGRRMTSSSSTWRRNRNWGWAFASPMRAFKPVSASSKSTFGNANAAVASINRSAGGRGTGNANIPPSSLLVGGG